MRCIYAIIQLFSLKKNRNIINLKIDRLTLDILDYIFSVFVKIRLRLSMTSEINIYTITRSISSRKSHRSTKI